MKRDLGVQIYEREKRRIVLKIPRCDTNGVGENEVTVTSGLATRTKQKEQGNRKEKRKLPVHPVEAQTKIQNREMVLKHGGAPLVAESRLGR